MHNIDLEYERYKDFDFRGAKPISNPKILEARARKKAYDALFDDDVQKLLEQHNTPADRVRLNAIIRALYVV